MTIADDIEAFRAGLEAEASSPRGFCVMVSPRQHAEIQKHGGYHEYMAYLWSQLSEQQRLDFLAPWL